MSPESLEEHSDIKSEICRVLLNLVRQQNLGRLHIDGVLISNETAGVSNEPDILYLSKASLKSGRAKLTPAIGRPQSSKEIVGSVDWVLEVVSPSSIYKDKVLLRKAYYQAGIDEYWIIDGLNEEIEFNCSLGAKRNLWQANSTMSGSGRPRSTASFAWSGSMTRMVLGGTRCTSEKSRSRWISNSVKGC